MPLSKILEELKKIDDKVTASEVTAIAATLAQYRETLHSRFGKIHEQVGSIDLEIERLSQEHKDAVLEQKQDWRWLRTAIGALATLNIITFSIVILRIFRILP